MDPFKFSLVGVLCFVGAKVGWCRSLESVVEKFTDALETANRALGVDDGDDDDDSVVDVGQITQLTDRLRGEDVAVRGDVEALALALQESSNDENDFFSGDGQKCFFWNLLKQGGAAGGVPPVSFYIDFEDLLKTLRRSFLSLGALTTEQVSFFDFATLLYLEWQVIEGTNEKPDNDATAVSKEKRFVEKFNEARVLFREAADTSRAHRITERLQDTRERLKALNPTPQMTKQDAEAWKRRYFWPAAWNALNSAANCAWSEADDKVSRRDEVSLLLGNSWKQRVYDECRIATEKAIRDAQNNVSAKQERREGDTRSSGRASREGRREAEIRQTTPKRAAVPSLQLLSGNAAEKQSPLRDRKTSGWKRRQSMFEFVKMIHLPNESRVMKPSVEPHHSSSRLAANRKTDVGSDLPADVRRKATAGREQASPPVFIFKNAKLKRSPAGGLLRSHKNFEHILPVV